MGNKFIEVLESYIIIDDPDLIAVESFIYSALESDTSSTVELKKNLKNLAKAKANDDKEAINKAKSEVNKSIQEVNQDANKEKDEKKKEKMKKIAKIGGIIAGTLVGAATIAIAANKLNNRVFNKISAGINDDVERIKNVSSHGTVSAVDMAKAKAKADVIFSTPESQKKIAGLQDRMGKFAATFKDKNGNTQTAKNSDEFNALMKNLDNILVIG